MAARNLCKLYEEGRKGGRELYKRSMDLLVKNAEGDRHVPTYQNAVSSSRKSREMATSMFIPCMVTAGGQSHDLGSSLHFGSYDPHMSPTHLAVSDVLVVAAEGNQNVLQLRSLWGKERRVSDPRPEPGPRGAVGPTPCPPILKCRLLGRVRKRSNWICFSAEVWIMTVEKPHAKSQGLASQLSPDSPIPLWTGAEIGSNCCLYQRLHPSLL